jgi:hypothetical protein
VNTRRRLLVLAGLALSSGGCHTGPSAYHVSAPDAVPPGAVVKLELSGRMVFHLDKLALAFLALDATPISRPEPIPSLMIRFEFDPATPGYSFNPMRVSVRTMEGQSMRASAYVGPGRIVYSGPNQSELQRYCRQPTAGFMRSLERPEGTELPARRDDQLIPLPSKTSCFVVSFPTTVPLGKHVELTIEGVALGAVPISIPTVRLSRRSGSSAFFERRPDTLILNTR